MNIETRSTIDVDALLKTIKPEHNVQGKRALTYKAEQPAKVRQHHSSPKPRFDKTSVDTLSRLFNVIDASAVQKAAKSKRYYEAGDSPYAKQLGKLYGRFYLATTDGTRALLLPNDGQTRETATTDFLTETSIKNCRLLTLHNSELFCAVKRALVMSDRRSDCVKLLISHDLDGFNLASSDPDLGDFLETVQEPAPCSFTVEYPKLSEIFRDALTTVVSIDGNHLLDALGSWPLRMFYAVDCSRVVFAPDDDSFRYVVALMDTTKGGQQ